MMACRDMTLNETFPNMSVEVIPMNFSDLPPSHTNTGIILVQHHKVLFVFGNDNTDTSGQPSWKPSGSHRLS
jgi:hypothetical protein